MQHSFIPDKYKRIEQNNNTKKNTTPKPPEPPYTIYSLTLFKLRRHDKTRTYWITFRDPVNPKQIQDKLNKAYRHSCSVYSGLITSKPEMHTCIVELPEEYEWGYIVSVTERVLSYLR